MVSVLGRGVWRVLAPGIGVVRRVRGLWALRGGACGGWGMVRRGVVGAARCC